MIDSSKIMFHRGLSLSYKGPQCPMALESQTNVSLCYFLKEEKLRYLFLPIYDFWKTINVCSLIDLRSFMQLRIIHTVVYQQGCVYMYYMF